MNPTERRTIGLDRPLRLEWLDAVAGQLAGGATPKEARDYAWGLLEGVLAGNTPQSARGKTLTVLSRVWLTPPDVAKSTGKLALVAGRIVRLDNAVWQISYGGGVDGLGLAIPAYYFSSVTNKADFKLGDCVTIFLDDGVKVFTVTKQS